jgi:hypothetical protein
MAYIGNSPFVSGNFSSTTHSGTGSSLGPFAIGQSPGTKNAVLVFIDGVRQVPTIYGVSGSDVTFTAGNEPPLGADNIQILVSGEELGVNVPADDSVTTVKILDDAVTTDKLANAINTDIAANTAKVTNATHTGDVTGATALTIANDAVTLAKMAGGTDGNLITYDASGDPAYVATGSATNVLTSNGAGAAPTFQAAAAGGSNAPAFLATLSASVAITDAVSVKALCNTELLDTDGLYDNSTNYRFTVDAASVGWYWISGSAECAFGTANASYLRVMIYRNGVEYFTTYNNMNSNPATTYGLTACGIVDLTTTSDYVELFLRADDTSGSPQLNGQDANTFVGTYFQGYKLAGVT